MLFLTDVLILNKEEALALLKKDYAPARASQALLHTGPKLCIVTDGKHGIWVSSAAKTIHVLPEKVTVCETTGAGDAFAASFLSGIIRKNDIEFAIRLGLVNSASVLSEHGAKNILLPYPKALKRMKNLKLSIAKKAL